MDWASSLAGLVPVILRLHSKLHAEDLTGTSEAKDEPNPLVSKRPFETLMAADTLFLSDGLSRAQNYTRMLRTVCACSELTKGPLCLPPPSVSKSSIVNDLYGIISEFLHFIH